MLKIMKKILSKFLSPVIVFSLLSLAIFPLMGSAAGTLSIACSSVSVSGSTWTMSGTWIANDFPGTSIQYDAAVFSPSGTAVDTSSKDSPDTFSIVSGPANTTGCPQDDMAGGWAKQGNFC